MNNNSNIKAIIFDLGNVLIDFDHMRAARKISQLTGRSAIDIFSMFFDSPLTHQFEEGKISPGDFFSQVKQKLNLKLSYEEFIPIWNEIFFLIPKNLEVHKLALRLKQRYTTALLSNINVLHFEYLKKTFTVFDAFHKIFLSYQLHATKPDSLIYEAILIQLGFRPQETFYTDDRLELIEAAKTMGINGFQFISTDQLKLDLTRMGVSIN